LCPGISTPGISTPGTSTLDALTVDDRDKAGLRDAFVDFIHTKGPQLRHDEGGGFRAVELQFGVGVQMASPALHFLGIRGDTVEDGHDLLR
jgi:hypothetical protein